MASSLDFFKDGIQAKKDTSYDKNLFVSSIQLTLRISVHFFLES